MERGGGDVLWNRLRVEEKKIREMSSKENNTPENALRNNGTIVGVLDYGTIGLQKRVFSTTARSLSLSMFALVRSLSPSLPRKAMQPLVALSKISAHSWRDSSSLAWSRLSTSTSSDKYYNQWSCALRTFPPWRTKLQKRCLHRMVALLRHQKWCQ